MTPLRKICLEVETFVIISCLKASAHTCIHVQDCTHPSHPYLLTHIHTNVDCFTTLQLNTGEATISPDKDNTCSLTFSTEEEMRYSVRFEEGYDLYDKRYESWLKINHPDVVSKTCTASSPHNTQISEAQQANTHVIYPSNITFSVL